MTVLSANISPTTSPIFIELISQKLSAYRCVVIEYSGSARVENGKCVEYGSVSVANPASLIPIPPTIVTATPPYFTQISGTCGLTNLGNVNC
ncbi:MAG: hypothetical protein QM532_02695 [Cyanobium sp. MAG06]|nr:hypothetical protein [Cyanobium sp. MAG06]